MFTPPSKSCEENAFKDNTFPRVYSVSEITQDIQTILEAAFDTVWIEGEISNYRVASSNHAYFVLKDEFSQIKCVLFRYQRGRIKFDPEDGDQVLLFGKVTVYEARGEYQVIVETLEPRGLGALQKAFEQLKEKLSKEGLFDDARKKQLPKYPWKIGIVTSPTGAAIRDMIQVMSRRNSKVSILLNPVKVQGEGAAQEIASAIDDMNNIKDLDLLIIGRGGGSIEDLWAFNEECVARAIHRSTIPVISAVGHEIDFTIADFVADVRAPTPSAAVEMVVPVLSEMLAKLRELSEDLLYCTSQIIGGYRETLRLFTDRKFFKDPWHILQAPSQRLDELTQRLARAPSQTLQLKKERLARLVQQLVHASPKTTLPLLNQRLAATVQRLKRAPHQGLRMHQERLKIQIRQLCQLNPEKQFGVFEDKRAGLEHQLIHNLRQYVRQRKELLASAIKNLNALSPLNILERGYSITTFKDKAVKSGHQVKAGDAIQVRLSKGKLDCRVEDILE